MKHIIIIIAAILLITCNTKKEQNFYYKINYFDGDTLTYKIIKTKHGYGYLIYKNKKQFIYQDIIPAIATNSGFDTYDDAEKTARYILEKMSKRAGIPMLTIRELDSLNVIPDNYKVQKY